MIILWVLLLICNTRCNTESVEDIKENITTLYPTNKTIEKHDNQTKTRTDTTTWKIETSYGEAKLEQNEEMNKTDSKEVEEKKNISNPSNSSDFKPSPHLGSFFDVSSEPIREVSHEIYEPFTPLFKKPPIGFVSSPKDHFKSTPKIPKNVFDHYNAFPYKFESSILTKARNPWESNLDSKPTVEVPMRVPAGGLYKYPDAFKEKPGGNGDDEDFGLAFNDSGDVKENPVKKRSNPWKSLLQLVTAFIPVGLIISALTPNVITIQSTGPGTPSNLNQVMSSFKRTVLDQGKDLFEHKYASDLYRRSDSEVREVPVISEPCRRRLLCELHSDKNYVANPRNRKRCYKIQCEDPEALSRALRYLLDYHRPQNLRARYIT